MRACPASLSSLCAPAGASGVTRHYEPASPSSVPIATRPAVRVMYRVERWQHGLDGPERTRGREDDTETQRLRLQLHAILESSPPDVPLLLLSVLLPEPNRHHPHAQSALLTQENPFNPRARADLSTGQTQRSGAMRSGWI